VQAIGLSFMVGLLGMSRGLPWSGAETLRTFDLQSTGKTSIDQRYVFYVVDRLWLWNCTNSATFGDFSIMGDWN